MVPYSYDMKFYSHFTNAIDITISQKLQKKQIYINNYCIFNVDETFSVKPQNYRKVREL